MKLVHCETFHHVLACRRSSTAKWSTPGRSHDGARQGERLAGTPRSRCGLSSSLLRDLVSLCTAFKAHPTQQVVEQLRQRIKAVVAYCLKKTHVKRLEANMLQLH